MTVKELKEWIDNTRGLDNCQVMVTTTSPDGTTENLLRHIAVIEGDNTEICLVGEEGNSDPLIRGIGIKLAS